MKKYTIIVLLLISFFITGCDLNKNKGKLIAVLEKYSYVCSNNVCERIENDNECKYTRTINFSTFKFIDNMYCRQTVYSIQRTDDITVTYNWKTGILESEYVVQDNLTTNITAIVDEASSFSCSGGTTENCNNIKTAMLSKKKIFLEYLAEANVELENLK